MEEKRSPFARLRSGCEPLSVEGRMGLAVNRQMRRNRRPVYNLCSHPKNMGPAHFRALEELCRGPYRFQTLLQFADSAAGGPAGT
jgi:hypothetical protein